MFLLILGPFCSYRNHKSLIELNIHPPINLWTISLNFQMRLENSTSSSMTFPAIVRGFPSYDPIVSPMAGRLLGHQSSSWSKLMGCTRWTQKASWLFVRREESVTRNGIIELNGTLNGRNHRKIEREHIYIYNIYIYNTYIYILYGKIHYKWSFSSLGKSSNYCWEVFPLDMAGGKSKDWWLRNQFLGNRKLCMVGNA